MPRLPPAPSRWLTAAALALVAYAYWPTLRADYVTQDQWRAFRYATLDQPKLERARACADLLSGFYPQTGRPLVWVSECAEHALVGRISDLRRLRPLALALVLLTVAWLGSELDRIAGRELPGALAAALFVLTPGYAYMYLQGLTAFMVLASVPLAAASHRALRGWAASPSTDKDHVPALTRAALLFLAACSIYPAWAFVVVALAWLAFCLDEENALHARARALARTLAFYGLASLGYYLMTKAFLLGVKAWGQPLALGNYAVSAQSDPAALWRRVGVLTGFVRRLPLLDLAAPPGTNLVLLAAFSAAVAPRVLPAGRRGAASVAAAGAGLWLAGALVLLAAESPWILSRMDELASRHLIPLSLFFATISAHLVFFAARRAVKVGTLAAALLATAVLLPVANAEHRLAADETEVSALEIGLLRRELRRWVAAEGHLHQRHILVVRPQTDRPAGLEASVGPGAMENAVLSSARNPISIPWMVDAVLREDAGRLADLRLADCAANDACVAWHLAHGDVAVSYTDGAAPVRVTQEPFVVNLSLLTARPVFPVLRRVDESGRPR